MREKGWVGRPIMVMAQAWCASHRIAVAKELGLTHVPVLWVPADIMDHQTGFNPKDPGQRYAHCRAAYGDHHPIVRAIAIEQGMN